MIRMFRLARVYMAWIRSPFDASTLSARQFACLLAGSRRSVFVVCDLEESIFGPEWVRLCVQRTVSRGVKVLFLVGPESNLSLAQKLKEIGAEVQRLKLYPEPHVAVADCSDVWYGGIHPQGEVAPVALLYREAIQSASYIMEEYINVLRGAQTQR